MDDSLPRVSNGATAQRRNGVISGGNLFHTNPAGTPRRDMGRTPFPARRYPTASGRTPRRWNFTPNRSGHAPLPVNRAPWRGSCTPRHRGSTPFYSGSAPSGKNFAPRRAGNAPFHSGRTPKPQNRPFSADFAGFTDFHPQSAGICAICEQPPILAQSRSVKNDELNQIPKP